MDAVFNIALLCFSWLFDVMLRANVSQEDIKIASGLGRSHTLTYMVVVVLNTHIHTYIHGIRQLFRVFSSDCRDPLYEYSGEGTPLYHPNPNQSPNIGKLDDGRDSSSNREKDTHEVVFATFAAGLAFLCGGSPTQVSFIHILEYIQYIYKPSNNS